jgi:hypothetical protein
LSPGRRTNRKNLRNCLRTITVLLLLFFSSTKNHRLQLTCFQPSAASPQAGDRNWCKGISQFRADAAPDAGFRDSRKDSRSLRRVGDGFRIVKNPAESAQGKGFAVVACSPSQPGSTLLPGLAGVEGSPEFLCGSCDLSVLGIAERDSCDVPCQQDPGR